MREGSPSQDRIKVCACSRLADAHPILQVSSNLGGQYSGEEGANAPLSQHAAPVSVTITAYGEGQVQQFMATNRQNVRGW